MSVEAYKKLIDEVCVVAGIPDPASMYAEANLQLMGIDFAMYQCVDPTPEYGIVYCDFGPLPQENRESVLMRLMQVNLMLAGVNSPTLACNQDNNHVMLATTFPVQTANAGGLVELMIGLANMAYTWRNGYFLNEEEQAGVPAGGALAAAQSTFNRFSSQFSTPASSASQSK